MNHQRPVNLDLSSLKYPPMAIVSILHRISGIVLFLLLPFMLCYLSQSLVSEDSYAALQVSFAKPFHKLMLWGFSTALMYHVIAGMRHLIMDLGFGEHLVAARRSAFLVIILSVLIAISLGVWIC